jgi:hypothetical protein
MTLQKFEKIIINDFKRAGISGSSFGQKRAICIFYKEKLEKLTEFHYF